MNGAPTSSAPAAHSAPAKVVDLGAIAHNVGVLRECAGAAEVMAVVKADAYGHGAVEVARTALAAGAAELGVATVTEAVELRRAGITAPVLAWLHGPGTDFAPAVAAGVQIAVSSLRQLTELLDGVARAGTPAALTLKVDTGLNRNGVSAAEFPALVTALARAAADGAVTPRGLMSHLVSGDEPDNPINDLQARRFREMAAHAAERGLRFEVLHLANSPATLTRPDLAFDLVRPGIAVYGLDPVPQHGDRGLVPAMTLTCPVAMVKPVAAGEGVSYGHTWIAERDTRVALLPIGYADGLFRSLGNRLQVLINGRRYPGVGRICMDQFVVDLGPGPARVATGDTAVLFGPGAAGEPLAKDWAELLGTIDYEVVTSPRGRVIRVYREAGAGV
ncbi:alanine racemase [Mycolicibacterium palauense]|uniref:alanine racemase n=1 Tax=Mycolicibacterium palauense TaxID=2034511 RepID=UPI000BFEEB24